MIHPFVKQISKQINLLSLWRLFLWIIWKSVSLIIRSFLKERDGNKL